jgi:hypothetical protein
MQLCDQPTIQTTDEQKQAFLQRYKQYRAECAPELTDEQILALHGPYWAGIEFTYTVNSGSDELEVTISLDDIELGEGNPPCFDTSISVNNGDWASLRDQQEAIGIALDHFYANGYDRKYGDLVGE